MRFDILDHCQRILAIALNGNARYDFPFAIQFCNAAPFVGSEFHAGYIAQQHRRAAMRFEHDLFKVADTAQVAAAAHHVFGFSKFNNAAADVHVGATDGIADRHQRNIK